MAPGERLLQFASISWDTSAEELYTCLTQGGTLVLRPAAPVESPETFLAWCEAFGKANKLEFTISISDDPAKLPESITKYA